MAVEPETGSASPTQPVTIANQGEPKIIAINSPTEDVALYQLAARWTEQYCGPGEDLEVLLGRFRRVYSYLDAVVHGLEPPEAQ